MEPITGQTITGKTVGILERLPHFCHVEQAGGLLAAVVDIFGRRLERAEADLYRVLRAHQVETADNEGFQGYTAPPAKRGDLDKIFALYLESLGGTDLLVKVNPYFTVRSVDARRLARLLVEKDNPLIAYFRQQFQPGTWDLLLRYDAKRMQFNSGDIQPGFALALLLGRTGIACHVRAKLAPATQQLLSAYNGGDALDPCLQAALAADLNERLLRDPSLFRSNNLDEFSRLRLPPPAIALSNSIYLDYLRERYRAEKNPLLASLQQVEPAEVPAGDDQIRLNRLLLEAAFPYSAQQPWGFRPRGIPMLDEVREALIGRSGDPEQGGELNRLLTDPALYTEERFLDLVEDYPYLQKHYSSEPIWLNRLLLESAFPNDIERSYAPYRERLLGLIAVLRRGASTLQGIIDIVAANLGIVGDDPQVRAAKALIQVEEFDPKRTHFFEGSLSLYQEFEVNNSNPDEETPDIRLKMLPGETKTLCNVSFEDVTTRQSIRVATRIQPGDTLTFGNGSVLLNGVTPKDLPVGQIPRLNSGITHWRFVADLVAVEDDSVQPAGRFDQANFGESVWVNSEPVVNVQVLSYRYTPGTFTVIIPWHIPGFTDKFAETEQHPRHQILALVNRVKAAGIQASVAYRQVFREDHDQLAGLILAVSGDLLADDYDTQDKLMASNTQQTREDQDIVDTFSLSGRFDLTRWDSLNSFSD